MAFIWSQLGKHFRRSAAVKLEAETTENLEDNPNIVVCVEPIFSGDLIIASLETTTPPYDPSSDSASFDITLYNDTGVALTSLTLNKSHDGNGSLDSPTMPSTLAVGASATVTLTYSTSLDLADVDVTFYVTATKPDATTATSATIVETVVIDPSPDPPEEPPPP